LSLFQRQLSAQVWEAFPMVTKRPKSASIVAEGYKKAKVVAKGHKEANAVAKGHKLSLVVTED
jgi:hypothetical protein